MIIKKKRRVKLLITATAGCLAILLPAVLTGAGEADPSEASQVEATVTAESEEGRTDPVNVEPEQGAHPDSEEDPSEQRDLEREPEPDHQDSGEAKTADSPSEKPTAVGTESAAEERTEDRVVEDTPKPTEERADQKAGQGDAGVESAAPEAQSVGVDPDQGGAVAEEAGEKEAERADAESGMGNEGGEASAGYEGGGNGEGGDGEGNEGGQNGGDGEGGEGNEGGDDGEGGGEGGEEKEPTLIELPDVEYKAADYAAETAAAYELQEEWTLTKEGEEVPDKQAVLPGDYALSGTNEEEEAFLLTFRIVPLGIRLEIKDLEKFYACDDPDLMYAVQIREGSPVTLDPAQIKNELGDILVREPGETVREGGYAIRLREDFASEVYSIENAQEAKGTLLIKKLPVTIVPEAGQEKLYGQMEPERYRYTAVWEVPEAHISAERIIAELKEDLEGGQGANPGTNPGAVDILTRQPGEDVTKDADGKVSARAYPFMLTAHVYANYEPVAAPGSFTIKPLKVSLSKTTITSRENSFSVRTEELDRADVTLDPGIVRKVVVEAKLPKDDQGIRFENDVEAFIPGAGLQAGLLFDTEKTVRKVKIQDYTYSTIVREKGADRTLSWKGGLPAGTKLTVYVAGENGIVSDMQSLTVIKQKVGLQWGRTTVDPGLPDYLGNGDTLSLSAADEASSLEYVKVVCGETTYHASPDVVINPSANDSGTVHNVQTATAGFVDCLNLEYDEAVTSFVYDERAFDIPSESILFHNRDKTIHITLPEAGTVTDVEIPGARVKLSGEQATSFAFDVAWSGKDLIPSGTPVTVTYMDRGGNRGSGSTRTDMSKVQTPIQMQIRPDVNERGFLTGSGALVVSGSACACEPISVTVAGVEKRTNVAAGDVWADENGNWELLFELNRSALPEREAFTITADYLDVVGDGASRLARYDEYVSAPAILSPVFRAMPYISGLAESDCAVFLRVGERVYQADVKEYGAYSFFMKKDLEMLLPGDTITVEVIDIAGNVSSRTVAIPEPGESDWLEGSLDLAGQLFYEAGMYESEAYAATPVSVSGMKEGPLTLPLLLGNSYLIGEVKIEKKETGIVVTSALDEELTKTPGSCEVIGESLYVFPGRPSFEDLRENRGREVAFGEVIPAGEGDLLWLVDGRKIRLPLSEAAYLPSCGFEIADRFRS